MREPVKNYELNSAVLSYPMFIKAGFTSTKPDEEHEHGTYYYSEVLADNIEVQITIDRLQPFHFDENTDVLVYDNQYTRVFTAFYDEDRDYPFGNDIIKRYNEVMDSLIEKKIFKPKELKDPKKLINKQ